MSSEKEGMNTNMTQLWANLQAQVARLQVTCFILACTTLIPLAILIWQTYEGVPIYYVPAGGPGLLRPGVVPDSMIKEFAQRWIENRYTFTPTTVKERYDDLATTLHPSLVTPFTTMAKKEIDFIREQQVSAQLTASDIEITGKSEGRFTLTLQGIRTVWVGSQALRDEKVTASMTVMPWFTLGRPVGLAVAQVKVDPVFTAIKR